MTIKSPHRRQMSARQIKIAREMRADEYSPSTIARRLGVTPECISIITKGVAKPHAKGW